MIAAILIAVAWLALFALVMCVVITGARADEAETLNQIRKIHTPSQLTHRQPGSISERSGKGDEAAFHEKGNDQ